MQFVFLAFEPSIDVVLSLALNWSKNTSLLYCWEAVLTGEGISEVVQLFPVQHLY